jgi:hypothetical protein
VVTTVRRCRPAASRPLALPSVPAVAIVVALAALVALVGLTTAGCGGGGGGSDGGAAHYANTTYRFSLDVDRRLTQWRTASAATGAAFEVSFVDTKGTRVGGRYLDALTVSVVDTGTSPTSAEAAQLTALLHTLGAAMVAKMGPDAQAGTVSPVSLNGLSGVVVPFAVTISGVRQVGWLYLLAAGGHIYALTAAASADQWDTCRSLMAGAIDAFRVG